MRTLLAAMLALTAVPPPVAMAAPQQQQAVPRAAALALIRLLSAAELIIGHHVSPQALDAMETTMRPQLGDMEKRRPGISRAVAMEMQPIVVRSARERLPVLWSREAMIYGAAFDDAELETLTAFFSSGVGQRVLARGVVEARADASIRELSRNPMRQLSATAIRADTRASEAAVEDALSPQDREAWNAFNASDPNRHLDGRVAKVVQTWANDKAPWEETELERAIGRAMADFEGGETK